MTNVYYTAHTGRRNACGHVTTRGSVYVVHRGDESTPHGQDALECIGEYVHQSGGAGIEYSILDVCERAGVDTGGGYFGEWRQSVRLEEL
jgi:hypothetical protein